MKSNFELFSNIEDKKRIYRIDTSETAIKLNDIKGKELDIKEFIIKKLTTLPKYDEEGKLVEDAIEKKITLLIDKEDKVYATGSKFFASKLEEMVNYFGMEEFTKEGFRIKIVEKNLAKSKNKALSFELLD